MYIILYFIIHPFDPIVVICCLIWPCDIAVCITYLISPSSSLSYNAVNKGYFRLGVYTKLPSCVDIIHRTSLGFSSWCPESTRSTDSCSGTSCEYLLMMADYINTLRWFCIYIRNITFKV